MIDGGKDGSQVQDEESCCAVGRDGCAATHKPGPVGSPMRDGRPSREKEKRKTKHLHRISFFFLFFFCVQVVVLCV